MDPPPNLLSLGSLKRPRTPDTRNDEPPERKTAPSLCAADKRLLKMYLPLMTTTVKNNRGISDEDTIHADAALSASRAQNLSGSALTSQEEMDHAEAVYRRSILKYNIGPNIMCPNPRMSRRFSNAPWTPVGFCPGRETALVLPLSRLVWLLSASKTLSSR